MGKWVESHVVRIAAVIGVSSAVLIGLVLLQNDSDTTVVAAEDTATTTETSTTTETTERGTTTTATTIEETTTESTVATTAETTTTTTPPTTEATTTTTTSPTTAPATQAPTTAAPTTAASSAGQPTAAQWQALRQCEATGSYTVANPTGQYLGAYQFDQPTWDGVAASLGRNDLVGVPPNRATPADQDTLAVALWNDRGWQPWPNCGRIAAAL